MTGARTRVTRSLIHGRGLFAAESIRKGQYIGTYRGKATTRDGMHVLWLTDEDGNYFGRRGTNALRYLNHADSPNAEFSDYELYAMRDIAEGEEITIDYGW